MRVLLLRLGATPSKNKSVNAVKSRLTILLPLKGRHLFTLRFLWHANKARLPYRFLIADGEVRPELAKLLEDSRKTFPDLDIEYIRYPDDVDFKRYYAKMADVFQRVQTPYVKIADNDDFLAAAGLECCMDFLDARSDYVCCSGGIAGFSLRASQRDSAELVIGPLNKLAYRCGPHDRGVDLNSPSATNRVLAGLRNTWNFYAVFRASAFAAMWKEVLELNPTNLQLTERFLTMRALTLGNAKSDPSVFSYCRQYWTSMQLHWPSQSAVREDFAHYLIRSRFTEDVTNVLDRISQRLAELERGDPEKIADRLREPLEEWVRVLIRHDFGAYATLRRHLRARAPWLLAWLKARRRLRLVWERKNLFNKLRKDGATREYVAKFKSELAQIEDVLTGQGFKGFLGQYTPLLVSR
jgi:glycosyltransferase domain-containing protein